MYPGVAGPQADTPWSAGSTSWPPFGWSGHQCTTPGVAGRPVYLPMESLIYQKTSPCDGWKAHLASLGVVDHRKMSFSVAGPQAGISWSAGATSGPPLGVESTSEPLEWLVHQWTSDGVAGLPEDLALEWRMVHQWASPTLEWLVH